MSDDDDTTGNEYTEAELLDWIKSWVRTYGTAPGYDDFVVEGPTPSPNTYCRHFGSFTAAVRAAGFTPRQERDSDDPPPKVDDAPDDRLVSTLDIDGSESDEDNSDDDTETVYVSPGSTYTTRYYHTTDGCDLLRSEPREWDLDDANAFGYELCSLCEADGDHSEINNVGEQSRSLRDRLEDDDSDVEYVDGHAGVDG